MLTSEAEVPEACDNRVVLRSKQTIDLVTVERSGRLTIDRRFPSDITLKCEITVD